MLPTVEVQLSRITEQSYPGQNYRVLIYEDIYYIFDISAYSLRHYNIALIDILNVKSSMSRRFMFLIVPMVLSCMKNKIQIKTGHIPGYQISIADSVSPFNGKDANSRPLR